MWAASESQQSPGREDLLFLQNGSSHSAPQSKGSSRPRSVFNLLKIALDLPASIILASLTINILGLALPLVVLQVFDRVLRHQATNTLALLILGLICVILAEVTLRFARNKLIADTALRKLFSLHMDGTTRFLNAPRTSTAKLSAESASDAMAAMDEMSQFLSGNGRVVLLDLPFVVVFLLLIWAIAGAIVVLPVVLIAGFTAWTIWSSAHYKRLLNDQSRAERERFDFYAECLKGIATVKALAVEPQMQRRFERILQSNAMANYRLVLRSNRMIAAGQLFASLTVLSIVTVGGLMAIEGNITIGAVAACLLIGNRITQPVLRIVSMWGQMEAARLAQERYSVLTELPVTPPQQPGRDAPAALSLVNVSMRDAKPTGDPSGIFLNILPAEVVGFVTPDITERAQLISVLRGQAKPNIGTVLIDGEDVTTPGGETLLQSIFFVGSRPDIFHGTILDNISMFRRIPHATALETARQLGVEPIIQALPQGYDTRLGDIGAAALPLDILQAICVIRATAMKPRLLLLDIRRIPPDDVSTRACSRAIAMLRGMTTVIVIGRHASEIKDADRTFTLQNWTLLKGRTRETAKARTARPFRGPPRPLKIKSPEEVE